LIDRLSIFALSSLKRRSRFCNILGATIQISLKTTTACRLHCIMHMNQKAEELKQRTFAFGLQVIRFCRELRDTWEGRELSDQLFRAGTRVGANYRAACRARSHPDFIVKIGHVVEEADETAYWLELIQAARVSTSASLAQLLAEAGELSAIFSQSQITAKGNARAYVAGHSRRPYVQSPIRP
jgi:four helix bundle protein